ncbi:LysR family transcriptional regulator [Planococcus dechangensis]|uniref:LysR family transcriptional regulator n=1 Tax=Planococcus dechangensis TaxID=1176255 RepID=A0ABV9MF29_9BACL
MNMRHLIYFTTLIEEGTFTKAANVLHIAQPSLSLAIKNLEKDLGIILFDRKKRELTLTREGEVLHAEAKKLLNHMGHVEEEMKRLQQQGPMELSVGMIESSKFWLPKVLKTMKQEYPELHIEIVEVLGLQDINKAIKNYDIHFAITNQLISEKEVEVQPIYQEKFVALLPLGHTLEGQETISVKELSGEEFIIFKEGFQTREDILNIFRQGGSRPNIQIEVERFETACSFVEEGLGVTFVPENYIQSERDKGFTVKKIQESNITRTVYLAYDRSRYLPPLVMRAIELVEEFFN